MSFLLLCMAVSMACIGLSDLMIERFPRTATMLGAVSGVMGVAACLAVVGP